MSPTRVGVIGTGGIARAMTRDVALLPDVEVVAVGSRTAEQASAFAAAHGVSRAHGSYEALATDPEVDVVYVATPHPGHHDAALLAIEAGKAVLVEKPFTMDAAQARALVAAARARGTFLMEAMWARFNPHLVAVREVLARGELGEVVTVTADHGQWFAFDPSHRLFAPELGGGALLDLGVYVVSFASMVLGPPSAVTARSTPTSTGVDAQTSMVLDHASGAQAVLSTTLRAKSPCRATVVGTDGRLEIDTTFYSPTSFTVVPRTGEPWRFDEPHEGHGLRHEMAEVARCLREGLTESPVMPLDETVSIMDTLDEVRRQIGLTYPGLP
ncbi:Gfo/Idh/MocA family oxidoreductase [Angustibacter peucedani]